MAAKRFRNIMSGIADARSWANDLVRRECRGPGDLENAMRRLEARYGIPWRTFWTLKYRAPHDVFVGVYLKLRAAYEAECARQQRLYEHERRIAKAKGEPFEALVRKTDALVGLEDKEGEIR